MENNLKHRFISADDHIDLRWLPRNFIDNSVLKEIEASGYIETVYGK